MNGQDPLYLVIISLGLLALWVPQNLAPLLLLLMSAYALIVLSRLRVPALVPERISG